MPRTVLIVDDLRANRQILRGMLRADYAILEAESGAEALDKLARSRDQISAVLLDILMPGMDGFEVLSRIRADKLLSQMPVIMITSSEDEATRVKSLALGANDFVMKPYGAEIIKHCLRNNIAFREAAATVTAIQRDRLTGLYGREPFFEKARELVTRHPPGHYIMACFDIDKFKVVNDQYGIGKGDEVLRHIADVFREGFEPNGGICCRVSADHFAVLYPAAFMETPRIEAIRESASRVEGLAAPILFSIGRYLVTDTSMPPFAMYDRAMLAAASIKGRYDTHTAMYDETMRESLIREQEIVSEMEDALKARQFEVWFQPQYNHSTRARIGAEALVRWRHPQKGLIPPCDFIALFEQNGFVYSLDRFVWEEVCRYLRLWMDEGRAPLPISVNISRYDMFRPDMVEVLTALVLKYRLPKELLRLEVTESAFATDSAVIIAVVKELIGLGFTVEIDDFGSGYSSLNTLKDVPAQILKLDMRFFESSSDSQRGGNIVESVVRMAKWLGMAVIAEGVETAEQADYLRSIGCNYMQGYYFAKPLPVGEYLAVCGHGGKEERLLTMETVENLDNNAFWDPKSMDTLIFNSYIGCACIFEYHSGVIELLRATEKYARMIGSDGMTVADLLNLRWEDHLDAATKARVTDAIDESAATKKEVTGEYVFRNLPGCPAETHLRATMRVIASTGERYLVYCTNENVTAQREAEREAREAAEQVRTLMNDTPGGFARMRMRPDGSGQTEYANEGFCKMLGMTLSEVLETYETDLMVGVHPDDLDAVSASIAHAIATDGLMNSKYRLRAKNGEYVWMQVFARFVREQNGDVIVNCYYANLSASEKQALSLRETVPFILSAIMNSSQNLDFAKDKDFNYICCSPAFVRFTRQKSEADVIGKNDYDFWTKEEADRFRADDERLFAGGESLINFTEPIPSDDDVQHYSVTSKHILRDSAGEIIGLYGSGRDVTDIRSAFDQLKLLTDSLPGGIARFALSPGAPRIVYFNDGFCKMLGCTREKYEELARAGVTDRVFKEDLPALLQCFDAMYARGEPIDIVYRNDRADGNGYIWINMRGELSERAGDVCFFNAVLYDVTAQYEAERLEKRLLDNLPGGAGIYELKDGQMRLAYQNKRYWELVGLGDACFPDNAPMSAIHPDDVAVITRELSDAIAQGRDVRCDIRLRHLTRGYIPIRLAGRIVPKGPDGFLIYATFTPTEQNGLTYQQTLPLILSAIMDATNDFAFAKDQAFRYICCSPAMLRLIGLSSERDAVGKTDDELFPPDMAKQFRENDLALLKSGKPMVDFDETIRTPDGRTRYCLASKYILRDSAGAVIGIYGTSRDVTRERGAMERLRMSEEENTLAARLGGNIVMRYNVADRSLTITPSIAAAYALPELVEDVPYAPVRMGLVAPESEKAYVDFYEAILNGSEAETVLCRQRLRDQWRWVESKSSTIFSDEGKPVKAIISLVDVTEQLEKETVYKKWQHSLEDRTPESYTLFRCNLNRDASYDMREGLLIPPSAAGEKLPFRERAMRYAEMRVHPDDRETFVAFINPDALLAGYYRGKRSGALEYRELLPAGGFRWLRLSVDLVEYPSSTDVEAYLMYENIDAAKRAELLTKERSETDSLTGLLNRVTFASRVNGVLRGAKPGTKHALLMLDIDGFKCVNDAFGHAAGDQALVDIARDLRSVMRRDDLVARLGGDEFVAFLADIAGDGAALGKADQIRALIRKSISANVRISASVGVAFAPRDGTTFDALYRKADTALYRVKDAGKDNCAAYRDGMTDDGGIF